MKSTFRNEITKTPLFCFLRGYSIRNLLTLVRIYWDLVMSEVFTFGERCCRFVVSSWTWGQNIISLMLLRISRHAIPRRKPKRKEMKRKGIGWWQLGRPSSLQRIQLNNSLQSFGVSKYRWMSPLYQLPIGCLWDIFCSC